MKLRAALWLVLCVPLTAGASRFTVQTPAALELATFERRTSGLADIRLTTGGVESAFGIRLDMPGTRLVTRLPLMIGSRLLVLDRDGVEYRLTIRSVIGTRMSLELLKPGEAPAGPRLLKIEGRYRLQSFTIDGGRAATAYPDLELGPDGRYRMGGGLGRWQFDGWILALDGYYGHWGPADVSSDGRTITFRFFRGLRVFQIAFARVDPAPAEKVAALEPPPG
jgi:hypothetical protein